MKFSCRIPDLVISRDFIYLHVATEADHVTFTCYAPAQPREHDAVYVSIRVPAQVVEQGSASFLSRPWKACLKKEAEVVASATAVMVTFGPSSVQIDRLPGAEIQVPTAKPCDAVLDLDMSVMSAIGDFGHLAGINVLAKGGKVQFQCTNGFRMHRTTRSYEGADAEFTVPRLALLPLKTLRKKTLVTFNPEGTLCQGDVTVHFTPLDGFPMCDRIVPQYIGRTTVMPVSELLAALKAFPKPAKDQEEGWHGLITLADKKMRLHRDGVFDSSFQAQTFFEASETPFFEATDKPLRIGVDFRYLREALEFLGDGATLVTQSTDLEPLLFLSADKTRLSVLGPCCI